MTIFVLTIFGGSVSADDRLEDEIVLYVEQELSVLEDVTVEKVLPLYNTSDEVIAYLCMLSPSGYAVYDPIYKNILEFSLDSVYMRSSQNSQPNSDTPDMNSRKER